MSKVDKTEFNFVDGLQAILDDWGFGSLTNYKKNKELRVLSNNVASLQARIDNGELEIQEAINKFNDMVANSSFDFHPALKELSIKMAEKLKKEKIKLQSDIDDFNVKKKQARMAVAKANNVLSVNNPTRKMIDDANHEVYTTNQHITSLDKYPNATDPYIEKPNKLESDI